MFPTEDTDRLIRRYLSEAFVDNRALLHQSEEHIRNCIVCPVSPPQVTSRLEIPCFLSSLTSALDILGYVNARQLGGTAHHLSASKRLDALIDECFLSVPDHLYTPKIEGYLACYLRRSDYLQYYMEFVNAERFRRKLVLLRDVLLED